MIRETRQDLRLGEVQRLARKMPSVPGSHCSAVAASYGRGPPVNLLTRCLVILLLTADCTNAVSAPPSRGPSIQRGQSFTVSVPSKIRVTASQALPGSLQVESTTDLWLQMQRVHNGRVTTQTGRLLPRNRRQKITPNAVLQHSGQVVVTFAAL